MGLLTDVNIRKSGADADGAGKFFWRLKELAIDAGWVVKGSGDGQALYGYEGELTLAAPDRANGGAYDCLKTGAGLVLSQTPADFGPEAWCVLENDGRELLLAVTVQAASGWDGYGRIAYAPRGSGGFDGSVADATTIPGAATNEVFLWGARATPNGAEILLNGEGGYVHLWADDTAELGVHALGFAAVDDSVNREGFFCIAPIVDGTESADDDDPCIIAHALAGLDASNTYRAWNYGAAAMGTFTLGSVHGSFYGGNGAVDPASGADRGDNLRAIFGAGANEIDKGHVSIRGLLYSSVARVYPEIAEGIIDAQTKTYCYHASGFLFPWPNSATAPLP